MRVLIERFEGDYAIIELPDKTYINVPRKLFSDFCEGDFVSINKIISDKEEFSDIFED